jgi:type I restriction enzyme S subunit
VSSIDRSALPSHWELVTMGDIADVVGGSTPKSKEPTYWDGDIRWLGVADLTGYTEKYISRGARSITQAGYDSCSTQMVPAGTVLFSSRAPIGYVALAAEPLCTSQGFKSFVLAPEVSPEYVYWYLKHARPLAESMASGTTFRELSGKAAAQLPIPLPPRREQERIVQELEATLASVSAADARVSDAVEGLLRFRSSVVVATLRGGLAQVPDDSDDARVLLDRILQERREAWFRRGRYQEPAAPSPIPGFALPAGWVWATVDQLATMVQYGSSAKTKSDADGVPVLRMGNIQDGRLSLHDLKYLPQDHGEFPELLLQEGDLLFNRTNSPELVGKAAVVRDVPPPCSFASYLIRVRLSQRVVPEWVSYFLNSAFGRSWVKTVVSQQVGQANVNGTKLRGLTIPLPPTATQRALVAAAERSLDGSRALEATLVRTQKQAQALTHSLLNAAFTGALVGELVGGGSATELLERIRQTREQRSITKRRTRRAVPIGR